MHFTLEWFFKCLHGPVQHAFSIRGRRCTWPTQHQRVLAHHYRRVQGGFQALAQVENSTCRKLLHTCAGKRTLTVDVTHLAFLVHIT